MANKYTDAVYKCPLRATEKIVLWVLAEHADNETGVCWPGQSRIAHYAGMNYSTAQRALDKLVSRGLIKVTGQRPVRGSTALFTKEYTLDLPKIKSYLGEDEPEGGGSAPSGTGASSAKARTGSGEPTGSGSSAPALTGSGKRTTVGGAPNELVLNSSLNSSSVTRKANQQMTAGKTQYKDQNLGTPSRTLSELRPEPHRDATQTSRTQAAPSGKATPSKSVRHAGSDLPPGHRGEKVPLSFDDPLSTSTEDDVMKAINTATPSVRRRSQRELDEILAQRVSRLRIAEPETGYDDSCPRCGFLGEPCSLHGGKNRSFV